MTAWTDKEWAELIVEDFDLLGILPHTMPNAIGMWPNEQLCLVWCALQADPAYDWWEIGSFCGGSTVLLGLAKKQGTCYTSVVAVDPAFNPMFDLNIKRAKLQDVVSKVKATSLDALNRNDAPISFAFIDGWHSFKAVVSEFEIMRRCLTDDAIIAFHDVSPMVKDLNAKPSGPEYIRDKMSYVKANWNTLISETEQDFRIDEAVIYICEKYGYEVIEIPVQEHITHFQETGLKWWVRGKTSPYNAFVAIRKKQ